MNRTVIAQKNLIIHAISGKDSNFKCQNFRIEKNVSCFYFVINTLGRRLFFLNIHLPEKLENYSPFRVGYLEIGKAKAKTSIAIFCKTTLPFFDLNFNVKLLYTFQRLFLFQKNM